MENINALDEIHKGCCMGIDALNILFDKVEDKKFESVLKQQYDDYDVIAKKIENIYPKYNDGSPHSTNAMNKTMTKSGIEMRTFNDKSNSKIAEILLQGVNMGIIEGKRILNNKKMDKEVKTILDNYVKMQEEHVEVLKEYL